MRSLNESDAGSQIESHAALLPDVVAAIPCIILFYPAGVKMEAERINTLASFLSDLDARARELRRYL